MVTVADWPGSRIGSLSKFLDSSALTALPIQIFLPVLLTNVTVWSTAAAAAGATERGATAPAPVLGVAANSAAAIAATRPVRRVVRESRRGIFRGVLRMIPRRMTSTSGF
jgi:hypothetical protein